VATAPSLVGQTNQRANKGSNKEGLNEMPLGGRALEWDQPYQGTRDLSHDSTEANARGRRHIHESPEATLGQETQTRLARGQPRAEHAVTTRGHPRARDTVPARQRPTSDKQRNSDSPDSISGDALEGAQLN
jgi:hypothetical protein